MANSSTGPTETIVVVDDDREEPLVHGPREACLKTRPNQLEGGWHGR